MYFLGIDIDGTSERTMECFQAAKNRHLSILKETDGVMAEAICKYFETWNPSNALHDPLVQERWEELNEGGNLIFTMSQLYAQDDASIRMAWENRKENLQEETKGICLVTGEKTEIARIHRGIKGVPGAQSSGAALVSFNAPAFESYGKEQSYNAPVGKYAEFAYTTALNYLLNQKEYTFQLGDSLVVFWAESAKQEYQKMFFFLWVVLLIKKASTEISRGFLLYLMILVLIIHIIENNFGNLILAGKISNIVGQFAI